MKKEKVCLIITGCINPNPDVPVLALKSFDERRRQYIDSIIFYLEKTNFKYIIFCDNSNAEEDEELYKIAEKYGKKFEWISFQGNDSKVIEKGKGYGEVEIINYVIAHSEQIQQCNYLVKVTGRLKILNINWFTKLSKDEVDYFLLRENNFVDTRCYGVKISTFEKYFSGTGEAVNDKKGVYLEHVFYNVISEHALKYKLFPIEPEFAGVSGSNGYSYDTPHYKNVIKSILAFIKHR